jgi:hypothetical protein
VEVKPLPTLPTSTRHSPTTRPFDPEKFRIWAAMLPKRVVVPKMIASASANCVGFATRMWANATQAAAAPLFSKISSGTSSGTCQRLT